MVRQVFLLRVNPDNWMWGNEPHNWDDLEDGGDVSFDGNCENHKHVKQIKLHDVFLGYNMDHPDKVQERNKCVVCIGRIISDGRFKSVGIKENQKRFLVQKVITLKRPLPLAWMKKNLETRAFLSPRPAVIKLVDDDWQRIKQKILTDQADLKEGITLLEGTWPDIQIPHH